MEPTPENLMAFRNLRSRIRLFRSAVDFGNGEGKHQSLPVMLKLDILQAELRQFPHDWEERFPDAQAAVPN